MPFGEGWPFIEAVRCEEAAIAAADGSRVGVSWKGRFSGMDCGMCVGELFFDAEDPPAKSFLEKDLVRLLPVFSFSGFSC